MDYAGSHVKWPTHSPARSAVDYVALRAVYAHPTPMSSVMNMWLEYAACDIQLTAYLDNGRPKPKLCIFNFKVHT
jgi:hypothetical protein